jgi:iron complex outermembrane receptor protein
LTHTNLTLGARYTVDKRELTATGTLSLLGGTQIPAVPPQDRSSTFKQPTWRISLDHEIASGFMVYGSYSRGFHSGVYNLAGNVVTYPVVKPETLDAFELGAKSTFAHRLRLDVATFYYNYKNLQLTEIEDATEVLLNAARARMYGVDLNLDAAVTEGLSLKGGAELMRGYYTSFPAAPITSVSNVFPFGDNIVAGSAVGHWLDKTPEYDFNLTGTYDVPLARGDLSTSFTYAYTGKYYWEPDNRLVQGAHGLLNGAVKWTSPDSRYYVRAFASNLLNKRYFTGGITGATGDIGLAAPGRTYGLALGVSLR